MRISYQTYFFCMAVTASLRSTCPRRAVGCVLVESQNTVVSTGYNGSPSGLKHCEPCVMVDGRCINTVHAEANAVIQARGLIADVAYCTDQPCINCYKTLISHNPKILIYYLREYNDHARNVFVEEHGLNNLFQMSADFIAQLKEYTPWFAESI